MKNHLRLFSKEYWPSLNSAIEHLQKKEESFLIFSTIYYLIADEETWESFIDQLSEDEKSLIETFTLKYVPSCKVERESKIVLNWLCTSEAWERIFIPVLTDSILFQHVRIEEICIFPACILFSYKCQFSSITLQPTILEEQSVACLQKLVSELMNHIIEEKESSWWKLDTFVSLLLRLRFLLKFEAISSIIIPVLQEIPLQDIRFLLSKNHQLSSWNTFFVSHKIPVAGVSEPARLSIFDRLFSEFYRCISMLSVSKCDNEKTILKIKVSFLNNFLLWLYFVTQNASTGLHLGVFCLVKSTVHHVEPLAWWKYILNSLTESSHEHFKLKNSYVKWHGMVLTILLRISDILQHSNSEKLSEIENSLQQLLKRYRFRWMNATGTDPSLPTVPYLNAMLTDQIFVLPPCPCYPSMRMYLSTVLSLCKADLAWKLYSASNSFKDREDNDRSFIFSVLHLEHSEKKPRKNDAFPYCYTAKVRFCSDSPAAIDMSSLGKLGMLYFTSSSMRIMEDSSYVQPLGFCYSCQWLSKAPTESSSQEEASTAKNVLQVIFCSNDCMLSSSSSTNDRSMRLLCLEAASDIQRDVIQLLGKYLTDDTNSSCFKHFPPFYQAILTHAVQPSTFNSGRSLVSKQSISKVCWHPYFHDNMQLLSLIAATACSVDISIDNTRHPQVQLKSIDHVPMQMECCLSCSCTGDNANNVELYDAQLKSILASWLYQFVLVRGPPGTGKTEVSSCVASFVLQNYFTDSSKPVKQWNQDQSVPLVLVVAQSNAAADHLTQKILRKNYLEKDKLFDTMSWDDILHSLDPLKRPILRLGRQCTEEVVREFTMEGHYKAVKEFRAKIWEDLDAFEKGYQPPHIEDDRVLKDPWLLSFLHAIKECKTNKERLGSFCQLEGPSLLRQKWKKALESTNDEKAMHRKHLCLLRNLLLAGQQEIFLESFSKNISEDLLSFLQHCQLVVATFASLVKYADYWPASKVQIVSAIVEEAAQVPEWNQFILFSKYQPQRVLLIGDDLQLSPVVPYLESLKGSAAFTYSSFYSSLFSRLIHLNFPFIQLEQQGRAAPCISNLFRFRYETQQSKLSDIHADEYFWIPPGVCSRVLFIHVSCHMKTSPYENPDEARAVASFLHYLYYWNVSWQRVTVLTPYQRQKRLMKQTLTNYFDSCGIAFTDQMTKKPLVSVLTTDEFQGRENDIVLISLVAHYTTLTRHMRDERRINIITSRARCGIYLFGNYSIFSAHVEWQQVLNQIPSRCVPHTTTYLTMDMVPLCHVSTERSTQLINSCAWRRKDTVKHLQNWLFKKHQENVAVELNQRFANWKI